MDGPHIRLNINDIRKSSNDDNLLEELIVLALYRLSKAYKFPYIALLTHIPKILEKVKVEISKFDTTVPYPPQNTNILCIQFHLPEKEVKIGVAGWFTQTVV